MSLLDTIKGAREEAQDAISQRTVTKKDDAADDAAETTTPSTQAGFSRRSAARAKPSREAAGSVRGGSKPKSEMTKEEKKAAREAKRTEEDLIFDLKKTMLENDETYKRTQRIWWGLLIAGIALTVISWGIMQSMRSGGSQSETMATVSIVCMVLAYALVIGAFIFDMVKVRPLLNKADERIVGMSKRRMQRTLDEELQRKEEQRKASK